ncbi:hypothetical protein IFR05_003290 [Cadophora sp. M221]|nr:hypothetical protein IFR05_003290 [Cadophora sp. M221]
MIHFLILLLLCPGVRCDWWDDFTNNLATDLAPIISLFGVEPTKQFLSESISHLDYFILAMAPIGIITAVISAIRVRGGSSMRAFIGRGQEGMGSIEAELCSSTSGDVCELYNNGGIARVMGRPKILEIVVDKKASLDDFFDGVEGHATAGIYGSFEEYYRAGLRVRKPKREWEEESESDWEELSSNRMMLWSVCIGAIHLVQKLWEKMFQQYIGDTSSLDEEEMCAGDPQPRIFVPPLDAFPNPGESFGREFDERPFLEQPLKKRAMSSTSPSAKPEEQEFAPNPNISLNVWMKPVSKSSLRLAAACGATVQAGVVAVAAVVTLRLKLRKEESEVPRYGFPLFVSGTAFLCVGIYLCAFLVGDSTKERQFRRRGKRTSLFWLQPGGQVVGDQTFDPFAYTDDGKLQKYTTSWKKKRQNRGQVGVWVAVALSVLGFVMQFVGIRALHSSISLAQLGAIVLMSLLRSLLRSRRRKHETNLFHDANDDERMLQIVEGYELDWLAIRLAHILTQNLSDEVTHDQADEATDDQSDGSNSGTSQSEPEGCSRQIYSLFYVGTDPLRQHSVLLPDVSDPDGTGSNLKHNLVHRNQYGSSWVAIVGSTAPSTATSITRPPVRTKASLYATFSIAKTYLSTQSLTNAQEGLPILTAFAIRKRLARITMDRSVKSNAERTREGSYSRLSGTDWSPRIVPVRKDVMPLVAAIEATAMLLFSPSNNVRFRDTWKQVQQLSWAIHCTMSTEDGKLLEPSSPIYPRISRSSSSSSDWVLDPSDIEAVLGLWTWSLSSNPILSRASTKWPEEQEQRRYIQVLSPPPFQSMSPIWETEPQNEPRETPLNQLCAQHIFFSFLQALSTIIASFGGTFQFKHRGSRDFYLSNSTIDHIASIFVENKLGTHVEALRVIVEAFNLGWRRHRGDSGKRAAESLWEATRLHTKDLWRNGAWNEAESLLRWLLQTLRSHYKSRLPRGAEISRKRLADFDKSRECAGEQMAATWCILGELYRFAYMKHNRALEHFWREGLIWMHNERYKPEKSYIQVVDFLLDGILPQELLAGRSVRGPCEAAWWMIDQTGHAEKAPIEGNGLDKFLKQVVNGKLRNYEGRDIYGWYHVLDSIIELSAAVNMNDVIPEDSILSVPAAIGPVDERSKKHDDDLDPVNDEQIKLGNREDEGSGKKIKVE